VLIASGLVVTAVFSSFVFSRWINVFRLSSTASRYCITRLFSAGPRTRSCSKFVSSSRANRLRGGCDQKIENPDSAEYNPRSIDTAHAYSRVSSPPNTCTREKHVHTHAYTHYAPSTSLSRLSCVLHRVYTSIKTTTCVRFLPASR
jgi:hypothetical protein